jgi:hypothetical protein
LLEFFSLHKDVSSMRIKRSKDVFKFNFWCKKYLYTLCVFDSEKVDKLKKSFPPYLQTFKMIIMYRACVAISRYASTISTQGLEIQREVIGKLFLK